MCRFPILDIVLRFGWSFAMTIPALARRYGNGFVATVTSRHVRLRVRRLRIVRLQLAGQASARGTVVSLVRLPVLPGLSPGGRHLPTGCGLRRSFGSVGRLCSFWPWVSAILCGLGRPPRDLILALSICDGDVLVWLVSNDSRDDLFAGIVLESFRGLLLGGWDPHGRFTRGTVLAVGGRSFGWSR